MNSMNSERQRRNSTSSTGSKEEGKLPIIQDTGNESLLKFPKPPRKTDVVHQKKVLEPSTSMTLSTKSPSLNDSMSTLSCGITKGNDNDDHRSNIVLTSSSAAASYAISSSIEQDKVLNDDDINEQRQNHHQHQHQHDDCDDDTTTSTMSRSVRRQGKKAARQALVNLIVNVIVTSMVDDGSSSSSDDVNSPVHGIESNMQNQLEIVRDYLNKSRIINKNTDRNGDSSKLNNNKEDKMKTNANKNNDNNDNNSCMPSMPVRRISDGNPPKNCQRTSDLISQALCVSSDSDDNLELCGSSFDSDYQKEEEESSSQLPSIPSRRPEVETTSKENDLLPKLPQRKHRRSSELDHNAAIQATKGLQDSFASLLSCNEEDEQEEEQQLSTINGNYEKRRSNIPTIPSDHGKHNNDIIRPNVNLVPNLPESARRWHPSATDISTTSSHSSGTGSSGPFTIEEVHEYVLQSLPSGLREKIPASAWKKLFSNAALSTTSSTSSKSHDNNNNNNNHRKNHRQRSKTNGNNKNNNVVVGHLPQNFSQTRKDYHDDDESEISDLTNSTGITSSKPYSKREYDVQQQQQQQQRQSKNIPNSRTTTDAEHVEDGNRDRRFDESKKNQTSRWIDSNNDSTSLNGIRTISGSSSSKSMKQAKDSSPPLPTRSWHADTRNDYAPGLPPRMAIGTSRRRISADGGITSMTNSSSSTRKAPHRSVSFDSVYVRQYERVLEINPCTTSGPSVGLGWKYTPEPPKSIDEAEMSFKHRPCESLVLPREVREGILRDLGYTRREIASAVRRSLKAKHQRRQTYNNLSAQGMEYMVEKTGRKIRDLIKFAKKENPTTTTTKVRNTTTATSTNSPIKKRKKKTSTTRKSRRTTSTTTSKQYGEQEQFSNAIQV